MDIVCNHNCLKHSFQSFKVFWTADQYKKLQDQFMFTYFWRFIFMRFVYSYTDVLIFKLEAHVLIQIHISRGLICKIIWYHISLLASFSSVIDWPTEPQSHSCYVFNLYSIFSQSCYPTYRLCLEQFHCSLKTTIYHILTDAK